MPIVILIPTVICIVALFRDSVRAAFLNVYLPVFMIFPIYYYWKVAALPPIDVSEAVLFPLGVAICLKELPRWRFSWMDIAMAVFVFSTYYADSRKEQSTAATFDLFASLCVAVVPYMAGKLLIERDPPADGIEDRRLDEGRVAVVKRIVFCLFIASVLSAYEYRMGVNPFMLAMGGLFPDEHFAWKTQIRWGFGRVSGPYGQSELAGMMLFFGLVLALYMAYYDQWEPKFRLAPWLPLRKATIISWTIGFTLLMTQARGPWLGSLVAVPIALIGRTRRVLLATVVFGSLCLVGGTLSYIGFKAYANAPVTSAEQETAQYRQHLLDNYIPVAIEGGPWGWGQDFPRALGQGSIDNEYLFVALTQGWVGLGIFVLMGLQALYALVMSAIYKPLKRDRYFAFTLLGGLVGVLLTIFTVYLGNQPYELFFLMLGWSQALRLHTVKAQAPVFQQVFT